MYSDFMACSTMGVEERNERLTELICNLPDCNRGALRALMNVLYQIHCNNHVNAMDDKNLGIVTAPNILRNNSRAEMAEMSAANTVVSAMIENYERIFETGALAEEAREAAIASNEWVVFKRKLIGNIGGIRAMVADPDKHRVLSFDSHGDCVLFDSEKRTYIKSIPLSSKLSMRIPPFSVLYYKGKFWAGYMNQLVILDAETLDVVHSDKIPAQSMVIVGNDHIWVGGDGTMSVISAIDYSVVKQFSVGIQSIKAMVTVRDQVWAACKNNTKNSRIEIHMWDMKTHEHVSMFYTDMKDVFAMTTFGNKTVWTASDNPCVSVLDIDSRECIARINTHPVAFSICALSDQVWFGSRDEIVIINPKTYTTVGELRRYQTDTVISTLPIIHEDRVEVWSGSFDKSVCVWSVTPLPDL